MYRQKFATSVDTSNLKAWYVMLFSFWLTKTKTYLLVHVFTIHCVLRKWSQKATDRNSTSVFSSNTSSKKLAITDSRTVLWSWNFVRLITLLLLHLSFLTCIKRKVTCLKVRKFMPGADFSFFFLIHCTINVFNIPAVNIHRPSKLFCYSYSVPRNNLNLGTCRAGVHKEQERDRGLN